MTSLNILHISQSPLVGSPGNITWAINSFTNHCSATIIENDYPNQTNLNGLFLDNSILIHDIWQNENSKNIIISYIRNADIIHIHNDISDAMVSLLSNARKNVKFIYQIHSPHREGPLFFDRTDTMGIDFARKLVVAQHHPRLHHDYHPVPNIIPYEPNIPIDDLTMEKMIIFSPSCTSENKGKWSTKYNSETKKQIDIIRNNDIKVYFPSKVVHPITLFQIRKKACITIDDMVSGGWHQVTMEGLCAGNVVFCHADIIARMSPCWFYGAKSILPTFYSSQNLLASKIIELIKNNDMLQEYRIKSSTFYRENLMPERLISFFIKVYMEVLHEKSA